jgi:hypothetical protein
LVRHFNKSDFADSHGQPKAMRKFPRFCVAVSESTHFAKCIFTSAKKYTSIPPSCK